jgi:ectoine hydroxylase-related dioxygenase (phytanoyl-CoA dioxygenase family)
MYMDKLPFVPLPPAWKSEFERNGFLVVPGVLDSPLIERLIGAGDRLMASDHQQDRETMKDGWDSFRNVIALDRTFLDLLAYPKIFSLIVQLLGPNIHLLSSQLIYLESLPSEAKRQSRTPAAHGWHRDLYGVAGDLGHANIPLLAIKCGYYLTDVSTPGSGMTLFSPGSHYLKANITLPKGAIDPENAVNLWLKPGDVVLFENRTFHAGGINESGRTRKCIMMQYGFRWLKPVDYVQQPLWLLEECDPIQRQLLGSQDRDAEGRIVMGRGAEPLKSWCAQHNVTYQPLP